MSTPTSTHGTGDGWPRDDDWPEEPWEDEYDDGYYDDEYDDYERLPGDGWGGRQVLRIVGLIAVVAAIVAAAVVVWLMRQIDPPGEPGEQISGLVVPDGAGVSGIAALLEEHDVIANAGVFEWYVRLRSEGGNWRSGEYVAFRTNSSMSDAIDVLDAGPVPPEATSITIAPGLRLVDALVKIDEAFPAVTLEQLQAALTSGKVTSKYLPPGTANWEGLIAPDTYQFENDASAALILQTLADQQAKVLDQAGYGRAEALSGRSAYELVTIASMIEREAGTPADERGKVSRTISNRLDKGEPLGIDATILYGLNRASGGLTKADLEADSPYNSRKRAGLPPTPIALPSKASLEAAIQPTEGPWLYYVLVSNDPPTHLFTASYDEFLDAKDQAQEDGVF